MRSRTVNSLLKIEEKILYIEKAVMFLAMATMVIAVGLQVFFRYVVPVSVPWTEELSIICFIFVVFYGAAVAGRGDKHLGIKNLVDKLDDKTYVRFWYAKKVLILLFLTAVMVVKAIPMVLQGLSNTFTIIKIPMFFVLAQIPVFGLLMVFHTVTAMIRKDYEKELASKKKGG
jgi:TRAP-type C4-dicarboxylate transport system permease small subunit